MLERSLQQYGAGRGPVADRNRKMIGGNKTAEVALELGMNVEFIPSDGNTLYIIERTDLDLDDPADTRARELAIADNRVGEVSLDWEPEILAALQDDGIDLEQFWFPDELDALLADDAGTEGLTDPDEAPAVPDDPITKPGDVWLLGRHRVMCGDSTVVTDVDRLMAGETADICFTSPPYAEQRDYNTPMPPWQQLMQDVFTVLPMSDDAQVLVNLGMVHRDGEWVPYWDGWVDFMRSAGWRRFGWYVWDQGPGLPGDWNGRLAPSHEFIFHFNRVARKANKTKETIHSGTKNHGSGLRGKDGNVNGYSHAGRDVQPFKIPDSVVRVMRHKARGIEVTHPAVFPVELPTEMYEAFSPKGSLAFEPFIGSGSSILAAEQTGRTCYGMEISPAYCDVIVTRWENFTGQTATRETALHEAAD